MCVRYNQFFFFGYFQELSVLKAFDQAVRTPMIDCMIETMQYFQKEKLKILKKTKLNGEGKKKQSKKINEEFKEQCEVGGPNQKIACGK